MKNAKTQAITDLSVPDGSRDILSQTQECEQNDVTQAIRQDNAKMKVQYLSSLLFDLFQILQVVRTYERNFA